MTKKEKIIEFQKKFHIGDNGRDVFELLPENIRLAFANIEDQVYDTKEGECEVHTALYSIYDSIFKLLKLK